MNTQTRIQSQSKHTQILISIPIVTAKRKERWTWCHDGLGGPRWWSGGERRKRERERERGLGWVCHRFNGAAGARGCREKERNYKREEEKSESVKKKERKKLEEESCEL